jgi:GT2 family glycosyltransferase
MKLNLSIIVVTYNCSNYIERFLNELLDSLSSYQDYEVLLNDNMSTDITYELCKKYSKEQYPFLVLSNSDNIGFAKANNMLIDNSKFDNLLLLNPDVFGFDPEFWSKLFALWDRHNPTTIKLLNEDLSVQENVGDELSIWRRLKRISLQSKNYALSNHTIEVESGIMAFLLVSKQCFLEVGLLSENYFMYAEDHDWFFRARRNGYKFIFEPSLKLIHTGGGSAISKWTSVELKQVKLDMEALFIKNHFYGVQKFLLLLINRIQYYI